MKKNLIYCIYPKKAQDIDFKNYYGVINLMGRLFSIWNKKKQPLKIKKSFLLENIKHLTKNTLWLYLKELCNKNVISISKENYDNNTIIINFTDDFIKNYVNAEMEAETEAEDTEECDNEDIEEVDSENLEAEETKKTTNADYNPDDDYLPVEGWANTDRQDYMELLKKYGGKVPEIPEEVLNFDFGQFCDDDFKDYIIDKDKVIYFKPDDMGDRSPVFPDDNDNGLSVNYLLCLRPTGELPLITYLDIYKYLTDEYNHLKNNGKI